MYKGEGGIWESQLKTGPDPGAGYDDESLLPPGLNTKEPREATCSVFCRGS